MKPEYKIAVLLSAMAFLMLIPGIDSLGQVQVYRVLEAGSSEGIGFVNAGIPEKNTGTVTDENGSFTLCFGDISDDDTLRFSMIGYESLSLSVRQLKEMPSGIVYLKARTYDLPELTIVYPRKSEITLGTPVLSEALRSGFSDNNLGYELGIKINTRKRTKLKDINLNIGVCTYDSVTYRLNVYKSTGFDSWENILTRPVYLSFRKEDICKTITFDLREYSIIIEGETIITLEHYRDLGEGKLLFLTQFFTGTTWHRNTKESVWTQSPGQVGLYLMGQVLR
ncbi:MAG: carboxypeptidase-like regulatory domain-containing protein [Bacteroidales bacterium]|nr:carboxypeptidase-like regulatory domain-containing protein [Bacteroidales bacterium]MBN2633116.1 carboxypeptidase-like regulatory domain-containing protein [Bacteroidales bacterium]